MERPVIVASLLQVLLALTFTAMAEADAVDGAVTAGQVFAVPSIMSAFQRTGDRTLQAIDVQQLVDAALDAFPHGFRTLVITRFLLTTLGSIAIIVLLALPAAGAHYH